MPLYGRPWGRRICRMATLGSARLPLSEQTSENTCSRDCLETSWMGWLERISMTPSAERSAFSPRCRDSGDHEIDTILSFQTVSPRTSVNKGKKKDRDVWPRPWLVGVAPTY
jgi:hypothetical protein